MSSPYDATIVNLSSGQIHFADPSKPWGPNDFPNLPSTSLAFTARGRIEDGNVSTITFTNAITYENYEPTTIQANLLKALQIQQDGVVVYSEPRVGFLSTFSPAFSQPITGFGPSSIGAASIFDVTTLSPDTITNAIGKLDAWIANAFLYQPPSVSYVASETNAFYGGIQWQNPNVYNVLDKSVPYVNSILFIVGDPSTPDYLSFEINDCNYFPYKTYRDGISPAFYPVVKLRIFTDFFVPTADVLYSKNVMQNKCVRIISESGNATFPSNGKVFAINHTNGIDSYTTVSIYLPNLSASYPKDSAVPVRVVYLNKTDGVVNIAQFSTIQTSFGEPGLLAAIVGSTATVAGVSMECVRPIYSDSIHAVTEPYFSTYQTKYTYRQMTAAHNAGFGFRYGLSTVTDNINLVSSIKDVPFIKSSQYTASTQTVTISGLLAGAQYSTSTAATNLSKLQGDYTAGPTLSTLFPSSATSRIDVMPIIQTTPNSFAANGSTLTYAMYGGAGAGWATGANVSTDVIFLSSNTTIQFQLSTAIQWNDVSFPGDRSSITVQTLYTDINNVSHLGTSLAVSTIQEDFPLGTPFVASDILDSITATLSDSQNDAAKEKFFYNVMLEGTYLISSISETLQKVTFLLTNRAIVGGPSGVVQLQTFSTPTQQFQTDVSNPFSVQDIRVANKVTDVTAISGLYTPDPLSEMQLDVDTQNVSNIYFGGHKIVETQLYQDTVPLLDSIVISSGVYIYQNASEITTLPFPQNSTLTLSSLQLVFGENIYQDPFDPKEYNIRATVYPGNTTAVPITAISSLQSTIYIDTVSQPNLYVLPSVSTGKRIVSLLPRLEIPGTQNNMNDGVNPSTMYVGSGLNVALSSFINIQPLGTVNYSTIIDYNHYSSISSFYTDVYSRELLYTNGRYIHPVGHNFSIFNGDKLGVPNALYPDFTYDLSTDVNFGCRYASFVYETPVYSPPIMIQYINVFVNNPNLVSSINASRAPNTNNWFPNAPAIDLYDSKIKMHAKLFAAYDDQTAQTVETSWVNVIKSLDEYSFNDNIFDVGGCLFVSTLGASQVMYKSQINRRSYTKICAVVRIGIASDGGVYSGEPISFSDINVTFSDT